LRTSLRLALLVSILPALAASAQAEEKAVTFDNKDAIAGWTVTGDVSIDVGKTREGAGGGSLKVAPGGKAVWKLRDEDGSGKVEMWVFEDLSNPKDPKDYYIGPRWGLIARDGRVLVVGNLYARYLGGASTYSTSDSDQKSTWFNVQVTRVKRLKGWHKWTFDFDAAKGLAILQDDKTKASFDWDRTKIKGFAGVVVFGDSGKEKMQTIWVDDVKVTLGGPMRVKPTPPPPPPPFLPEKDPSAKGPRVKILDKVANQHPRLLITADRISQLKAFYNSPQGKLYREQVEGYVAGCTVPANRRTSTAWGQQYGLFKLPMVALHYVLTEDKASFDKSVAYLKWLAGTADWSNGGEPAVEDTPEAYAKVLKKMMQFGPSGERNSDHAASFTMVGAALTWDWLYNDLDPVFREQFRKILWQHARAMYYGGHLKGNPGGNYWRGVPAYNHRWFRDWGMTLAALGAAEGKPEEQWFLSEVRKELKFMCDWLPVDGSQHEGPGYGSSAGALGMAFGVSDDLTGTRYLDSPFYRTAAAYTLQVSAPGMTEALYFADCHTVCRSFHPFFLKTAATRKQADVLDGIRRALRINAKAWGTRDSAWLPLVADDPSITGGSYTKLPTTAFLPDLGIAVMRDSWRDSAVATRFKCGPMGGYKANAWREANKDANGTLPYLNVAHDHPDANSFVIFGDGDYMAETDRYPLKPGKLSTGHNTILINGIGQAVKGRSEGDAWQQPGSGDMTEMGKITAFKAVGDVVVVEGEAAGSYLPYTDRKTKRSRPALDRFRRTFIWVKGDYILVFDDVRSPKPVEVTYLVQGAKLAPVNEAQGRYRLSKNKARCDFQLVADVPLVTKIGLSTANDHNKLLGWQQLQATAKGSAVRFASVFDPWHRGDLTVTLTPDGPDKTTVKVQSAGFTDTWLWRANAGKFEAATLHGSRPGGFDVTVDAKSAVPPAP
jgi:hypothetical protein